MDKRNVVIIGGGPAGMAAAAAAYDAGERDILIIERDRCLGGILNQCIHNGFGLHTFKEELTGPEYAARYEQMVTERDIEYKLDTIVLDVSPDADGSKLITYMNDAEGCRVISASAVILAMGCRERPRGALSIPGTRPAGVYTAGTAQRLVNIEGKCVGRRVVILGSGDIGLIMARRMTLQGAKVYAVAELMPYSGGLQRNIRQCLDDFDIPLMLSHTVSKIYGKGRVEGVDISEVDENRNIIPDRTVHFDCDTLLLSCGLLPENELSRGAGVRINGVTGGPDVKDNLETSLPGVFACGNVLHVHDLVDYVSQEAARAGKMAAEYVAEGERGSTDPLTKECIVPITVDGKVRYTVPQYIDPDTMENTLTVRMRVANNFRNKKLCIYAGDKKLREMKKDILKPGEMEQVVLLRKDIDELSASGGANSSIRICLED